MSNRAARRREQKAGRMQKSPVSVSKSLAPIINVYAKNGMFVQQVALGPGYVAEMTLPIDLAENFVRECKDVITELRTGIKIEHSSSGLITP